MENRYIENVKDVAIVAIREGVAWNIAVDIYDDEIGMLTSSTSESESERTALRSEFYAYVSGRKYDAEGNEII